MSGNWNGLTLRTVKNAMRIIHLYSEDQHELGITEIARKLNLSKSTVHRLVQTLEEEGFLEKNTLSHRYRLGWKLLQLSGVVINQLSVFHEAVPIIETLSEKWGEAVHIGVLEGTKFVYLHKVESPYPTYLLSDIGKRMPASCTSGGKIILAYQPEKYLNFILKQKLPRCGPRSITCPNRFRRHLNEIKQKGYVVSQDELHKGVVSIAAPIRDYTEEVVAALVVAGPNERMTKKKISSITDDIVYYSKVISQLLGYY